MRGRPIEDVAGAADTEAEVKQQDDAATMLDPNMTEALAESESTSDPRTSAEPASLLDTDASMEDGFRDAVNDNRPLPVVTTEVTEDGFATPSPSRRQVTEECRCPSS